MAPKATELKGFGNRKERGRKKKAKGVGGGDK